MTIESRASLLGWFIAATLVALVCLFNPAWWRFTVLAFACTYAVAWVYTLVQQNRALKRRLKTLETN